MYAFPDIHSWEPSIHSAMKSDISINYKVLGIF